jgi:hypothetical protein
MSPENSAHDLGALLRSRVPLVVIETRDEARALATILELARGATPPVPTFEWTVTQGLARVDVDLGGAQAFNADPARVLTWLLDAMPGIYVLLDFHPYLDDPVNVRTLREVCQGYDANPRTVVLVSPSITVPAELATHAARFELAPPDAAARRAIVDRVAREWVATSGRYVTADETSVNLLVANLAGLSATDTERLARSAVFDDGAIGASDIPTVARAKYDLLSRGGVLSFSYDEVGIDDVAGMSKVKDWLRLRLPAFAGQAPELDAPRGVLLLGVQGCGKSLAAKAAAAMFGVPLLRMDLAAIHDKFVGESERKLRESLATADLMAPCVVWIDEIEKGLATSDGDSGSSQRVLGTFLTWLAEKRGRVFVVATANDISELPPELIRKGRFDEIFFVDLPDAVVRADLLRLHARRRDIVLSDAETTALAAECPGFSGAEIEQAVVSAAYAAHPGGGHVTPAHVLAELRATRPLSTVMAERVEALRQWAAERTVPAD